MATDGPRRESLQVSTDAPPSEQAITVAAKHSVFGSGEKKIIVLAASIAGFFSPLSSGIYLPALNTLAKDLHVSNSLINLTITTYLIFQGLAPTVVGGFSDTAGRRSAYIICFVIYIAANIGLALQNDYAALLVLRCVQSSGSSGTVALANAVVADCVTSAERGAYIGYASVSSILGPSLSPIIGGLLSQYLGWKSIFWFLTIFSAAFFLPFLLFFPETCRKVVGNGSIPPPKWNHSLLSYLRERKQAKNKGVPNTAERERLAASRHIRFPNPLATLVIVFDKEASLILLSTALLYSCYTAISASLASQFQRIYGFSDVQISLMFIPIGVGSLVSAFTTGHIVDWNYRRHAKALGFPLEKTRQQDLTNFPIEKARLQITLPLLYLGSAAVVAYGWTLHFQTSLAGPCILLFVIGYALVAGFNGMSILMVDIYPGSPATATAANNLVRCLLGAASSAFVIPMIDVMGMGWTCTLLGLMWAVFSPLLMALMKWGPEWRRRATERAEAKAEERKKGKEVGGQEEGRERVGIVAGKANGISAEK